MRSFSTRTRPRVVEIRVPPQKLAHILYHRHALVFVARKETIAGRMPKAMHGRRSNLF
jgi:hypothetical protein